MQKNATASSTSRTEKPLAILRGTQISMQKNATASSTNAGPYTNILLQKNATASSTPKAEKPLAKNTTASSTSKTDKSLAILRGAQISMQKNATASTQAGPYPNILLQKKNIQKNVIASSTHAGPYTPILLQNKDTIPTPKLSTGEKSLEMLRSAQKATQEITEEITALSSTLGELLHEKRSAPPKLLAVEKSLEKLRSAQKATQEIAAVSSTLRAEKVSERANDVQTLLQKKPTAPPKLTGKQSSEISLAAQKTAQEITAVSSTLGAKKVSERASDAHKLLLKKRSAPPKLLTVEKSLEILRAAQKATQEIAVVSSTLGAEKVSERASDAHKLLQKDAAAASSSVPQPANAQKVSAVSLQREGGIPIPAGTTLISKGVKSAPILAAISNNPEAKANTDDLINTEPPPVAIATQITNTSARRSRRNSDGQNEGNLKFGGVGFMFSKYFPGFGTFRGMVVELVPGKSIFVMELFVFMMVVIY